MKKLFLFAATVAMLLTTSCNNESNAPENVQLGENEFMVSIDNGAVPQKAPAIRNGMTTMTNMDGNNFVYWDMGDLIYINGTEFSASMSGNKVIFTKTNDGVSMPTPTYHAFYPESDIYVINGNTAELSSGTILDDAQDNGVKHLPMYACSNDKYLTFYNIFAVLKINIPSPKMKTLMLNSMGGAPLSGRFQVDEIWEGNVLKGYKAVFGGGDVQYDREINAAGSSYLGSVIYVAVPAQRYGTLRISIQNGPIKLEKEIDLSSSTAIANGELEVNKIYTVDEENWE